MQFFGSTTLRRAAAKGAASAVVVVAMLTSCGSASWNPGATNDRPTGAESSRAAVTAFLQALERRNAAGMRQMMTPRAQRDETTIGGLLGNPTKLSSFHIRDAEPENPGDNASAEGSIASVRFTVALRPADGFDDDNTTGGAYHILVSETRDKRWLVAELGGCC